MRTSLCDCKSSVTDSCPVFSESQGPFKDAYSHLPEDFICLPVHFTPSALHRVFIAMTTSGGGSAQMALFWGGHAVSQVGTLSLCLLLLSQSQSHCLSPGDQRLSRHFLVNSWLLLTAAEFQPLSSVGRRKPTPRAGRVLRTCSPWSLHMVNVFIVLLCLLHLLKCRHIKDGY